MSKPAVRAAAVLLALLLAALGGWIGWTTRAPTPASPASAGTPATPLPRPAPGRGPLRPQLLAGDGHPGWRDGPAAQARFADPYGLAVDAAGTVFVADGGDNNRIRRIRPDGQVDTWAGGDEGWRDGPREHALFHTPSGLAVDAAGNLYVADTGNHRIRKIDPQGQVHTLAGSGEAGWRDGPADQAQFHGPLAVAVDRQGQVYVADTYNDRIRVIGQDGQVRTLAGGEGPGDADGVGATARFDTPCGLALDDAGRLYVADTRNHALRSVAADGTVTTLWRGDALDDQHPLRRPLAVAAAPDGQVFIATARHGAVLRWRADAGGQPLWPSPGPRLSRPTALALDGRGGLLVTDAASARVHRLAEVPVERPGLSEPLGPAVPLGPAADAPLPDTGQRWPVAPQGSWHEVVGTAGEVRGDGRRRALDHLHDGLDVQAPVGATVLAIADAKVDAPLSTWAYGHPGEGIGLGRLTYVHLRVGRDARGRFSDPARFQVLRDATGRPQRVRVPRGTRFRAGDALGSVNGMAHLHLGLGVPGHPQDPLQLGFAGFSDRRAPRIEQIELRGADGRPLQQRVQGRLRVPRDAGALQIVVDAWDQVDGNRPGRRLGLAALGYQLLHADGRPAAGFEQPLETLDFSRLPDDDAAVEQVYAADSGITVNGRRQTRFLYQVGNRVRDGQARSGGWSPADWPAGDYRLRILARDRSGNPATGRTELLLRLE